MTRTLLYDIETSPNTSYTWGKWEQNVIEFKDEWRLLSVSWKWLDEKKVYAMTAPHNDKKLIQTLWKLFDEADVIIGHNSDQFDNRKVTARFAFYDLKPPSPYKTVDTKKVAKRYFNFNSNKLDDLGEYLKLGRKVKHEGFSLWLGCMANNPLSWKRMIRYNKQDVILLEKIYLRLRPYMTNHPKTYGKAKCASCGSDNVIYRGMSSSVKPKQRISCKDCGIWSTK
jgi:DNA polymerase elongation subunit (family B)/DNA-directed RNA polymerase subunit RPC12/RpoP